MERGEPVALIVRAFPYCFYLKIDLMRGQLVERGSGAGRRVGGGGPMEMRSLRRGARDTCGRWTEPHVDAAHRV